MSPASAVHLAHTINHPCEVCGGYDRMPQHQGVRCYGWSTDEMCFCTREERAPGINATQAGYYPHKLRGECACGIVHGGALPAGIASISSMRQSRRVEATRPAPGEGYLAYLADHGAGLAPPDDNEPEVVGTHYFEFKSLDGRVLGVQKREDMSDGSKRPSWVGGLKGRPQKTLLYGLERLHGLAAGSTVFLVEGPKTARALQQRGLVALGSVAALGGHAVADETLRLLLPFAVIVSPDNDGDGIAHMQSNAQALLRLGASSVGWLDPYLDRPHWDLADFDGDDDELIEHLRTMRLVTAGELSAQPGEDEQDVTEARRRSRERIDLGRELTPQVVATLESLGYRQEAQAIETCYEYFNAGYCEPRLGGCGELVASPRSCHEAVCPKCSLVRLWGLVRDKLPVYKGSPLCFYELTPTAPVEQGERRTKSGKLRVKGRASMLIERFQQTRKRSGIGGGWAAAIMAPAVRIVAAVDARAQQPGAEYGGFRVRKIGEGTLEDFAAVVCDAYAAEMRSVFKSEEPSLAAVSEYMQDVKNRHRLVGFGKVLCRMEAEEAGDDPTFDPVVVPDRKLGQVDVLQPAFSGSERKRKRGEACNCPFCNQRAVLYWAKFKLGPAQVEAKGRGWTWHTHLPESVMQSQADIALGKLERDEGDAVHSA